MSYAGWKVSAAVLLGRRFGIHLNDLTRLVKESGLTKIGTRRASGDDSKTLRTQLTRDCPYAWFSIGSNMVSLVEEQRRDISEHPAIVSVLRRMNIAPVLPSEPVVTLPLPPLPEEVANHTILTEGATKQIHVNTYEREAAARAICIKHHGTECCVCNINLAALYGQLAVGFIHVHHITPLATIGKEYKLDPIADLRPVCPNCHAIIHLGDECRSIEEVKELLRAAARKSASDFQ